jgi:uncharacterized protein DUF4175
LKNFNSIQVKLHSFIKKYYTNEIIKGSILFLSFGLLYFIFTLFIEYFLWLKPLARTILFWLFVFVELGLLTKFIIFPVLKLIGLKKGISNIEASRLIGKHFTEVDDKLLNLLQLDSSKLQTDLLLASIEQKSKRLQPIPFKGAVNFKTNYKYFKYLAIPIIIWLFVFLTGNNSFFTQSINRVINHKTAYNPPAPFRFNILNKNLQTVEGKPFVLQVTTSGNVSPEDIKIIFNKEMYYLNKIKNGDFFFEFEYPVQSVDFYLEANNITSNIYTLDVFSTPKIIDFQMELNYPKYTNMLPEIIENTGNASLPKGTEITWKIKAQNTNLVNFITLKRENNSLNINSNPKREQFSTNQKNNFEITKYVANSLSYQINTSNNNVKKFEELNYQLEVVEDQFPKIMVKSDIDSIRRGPVQFIGQLSDDYGISKLQVIAKNTKTNAVNIHNIEVSKIDLEEFYYVFPNGFVLQEGAGYEIYFEVFDNDGINGKKKSVSQYFYYNNKTQDQIDNEILLEQKQSIDDLESTTKKSEDLQKSLDNFSKKLKSKNNTDWNDKKQLDEYLERQRKYEQMIQNKTEKLLDNLEEMDEEENSNLEDKKQNLKKRIEEAKELQEKQDLLKELEELAEKLRKEDLLDRVDKLKEQSKQEKRSLERILELTKRFYVEKKSEQIIKKLDQLAKEQQDLSKSENNNSEKQQKLNNKFDSIQKDFNELNKQNKDLKEPMKLKDTKADQKLIEMEMEKAVDNLEMNENSPDKINEKSKKEARKNQNSAAKKMEELSEKMQESFMQMEMEGDEENIKDLQQILENLIIFSFDQEKLMLSITNITSKNAEYPEKLKEQIKLKEYFEHIDDSLYTLSLRLVRLSSKIQKDLGDAHYNLDKSLQNITENKISEAISNQHYTMTSANNLADLLSDILQSMQNRKPGSGMGKGKKGEELSLPDIIKKQGELIKKMGKGMEKGSTKGNKSKEQMSGEQFEIFQEQNRLKEQLNELLKNGSEGLQSKKVLQQMDELEKLLLEKGISNETLRNMQKLEHELLKLDNATFDQNEDSKRKSNTSKQRFIKNNIKPLQGNKLYFKEDEILIRNYLDLKPDYQKRIKKYYQNEEL